jgi:hypothetical protein
MNLIQQSQRLGQQMIDRAIDNSTMQYIRYQTAAL